LRRTHSGNFDIKDAVSLDELKSFSLSELNERVLPYADFAVQT